jgi:hypothetical protein
MQSVVPHGCGSPDSLAVQERLGRVTGLLFLVLAIFGMFAVLTLESLVVAGDAATTAANVLGSRWLFVGSLVAWLVVLAADIGASVTVYLLLEPVGRALSLVAAAFRLVYSANLGAVLLNLYDAYLLLIGAGRGVGLDAQLRQTFALSSLETFSTGFLLALVVFGVHLAAVGVLFYRSRYVPRALGVLLVAAGVGYILDSLATFFVPGHGGLTSAVLVAPVVVGELGVTAWLLVKGVDVRRESATPDGFGTPPMSVDAPSAIATGGTR